MTPEHTNRNVAIRTHGLSKRFDNIQAVNEVDLNVPENEITALVGDNGAGKSTLIKMLCGILQPTAGEIFVRGERVTFENYIDARSQGIETVYQDLGLARKQKVYENVFLGSETLHSGPIRRRLGFVDKGYMIDQAAETLEQLNTPVDSMEKVENLSGGQQQAVAIARALQFDPDIFIMDEPTSALSIEGVSNVLRVIEQLKTDGHTIVLISHNIDEVLTIADNIAVLANGELMGVLDAAEATRDNVVSLMMGSSDQGIERLEREIGSNAGTTSRGET
jgi:ABC-type sugar transport system ATPase subunit